MLHSTLFVLLLIFFYVVYIYVALIGFTTFYCCKSWLVRFVCVLLVVKTIVCSKEKVTCMPHMMRKETATYFLSILNFHFHSFFFFLSSVAPRKTPHASHLHHTFEGQDLLKGVGKGCSASCSRKGGKSHLLTDTSNIVIIVLLCI